MPSNSVSSVSVLAIYTPQVTVLTIYTPHNLVKEHIKYIKVLLLRPFNIKTSPLFRAPNFVPKKALFNVNQSHFKGHLAVKTTFCWSRGWSY